MASSTLWPVNWFFSSAVATSNPFTNSPRSSSLRRAGLERELPGDVEPVRSVPIHQLRREAVRRLEVGETDRDSVVDHTVAQHVDGAPPVNLRSNARDELRLCSGQTAVQLFEAFPCLCLGRADEGEHVLGIDASNGIEGRRCRLTRPLQLCIAAVLDEPARDVLLECCLVRLHVPSKMVSRTDLAAATTFVAASTAADASRAVASARSAG